MKKVFLLSLSLMLMLAPFNSVAMVKPKETQSKEPSALIEFNIITPDKIRLLTAQEEVKEVKKVEVVVKEVEIIREEKKVEYPKFDIPLSEENQLYAYELSKEFNIPIKFIYAIAHIESGGEFEKKKSSVHRNKNGTRDYGMMQLNDGGTMQWLAKSCGVSNFDWSNPKHSLRAGVWYLDYLRNEWKKSGYKNQDELMKLAALSYNMGMGNAKGYIKNHDVLDWGYVKKASTYANQLKGKTKEM